MDAAEARGTTEGWRLLGAPGAALTSTILVAKVGEAPDVSQANDLPSHRQDILQLVVPLPSLQGLVILLLLFHVGACRHRFAIADNARDSVIHPTFRRSFPHYIQQKPCNEAEIRGMGGKRGERAPMCTHTHTGSFLSVHGRPSGSARLELPPRQVQGADMGLERDQILEHIFYEGFSSLLLLLTAAYYWF